ncbi:uncharacterized protein LOC129229979 [Uloborus diversus]|uniref:uncharacterized protein LOC129229979 n=1 Tax=Uloborus diversus TaxID=327109 RepID=UPI0024096A70|nr:uncharacterized protein LOC129229979 [Uloborus diversus]
MSWLTFFKRTKKSKADYELLKNCLLKIKKEGLKLNLSEDEILALVMTKLRKPKAKISYLKMFLNTNVLLFFLIIGTISAIVLNGKEFSLNRCIIENNYFIMEMTRPITDCNICKNIDSFSILENVTKQQFSKYAYLGHPLLIKGGCSNWSALEVFNYDFFKELYSSTKGAFESVEVECQFFPFRTTFLSLQEVFNMPESRAKMTTPDEETWYIGWSNCNPDISSVLRQHYSKPHFLPDDSELSAIDWIFMGYQGPGASMHLDYVRRPSWQAQIRGTKNWYLLPPPECEDVCTPMNISVHRGDIILIDTNQWYHTTVIDGSEMSVTLGSEYD